jgi:arsenite methyltransferase
MSNAFPEAAVRDRYGAAALQKEAALCCPVDYDPAYLKVLPDEILEKDYGCGDPSRHLKSGDVVLDLGSGAGKICFIASQVVGPKGRVIGVDMNDPMLALARRWQPEIAARIGHDNVTFRKGRIQDLALDLGRLEAWLAEHPVTDGASLSALEAEKARLCAEAPLVPDGSVDVVVSNCVLNLVSDAEKRRLFREIHRVLRRGGRAAISDIVSDEPIPAHLKADPKLWSGCISGAMQEDEFLKAFEEAGFYGIAIAARDEKPWQVVDGIELRSLTVVAYKGKEGPCLEHLDAVVYKGPFRSVEDDDGHRYRRGERVAVCRKTFELLGKAPYADHFEAIRGLDDLEAPAPFACSGTMIRDPRESKRLKGAAAPAVEDDCAPGCC